MVLNGTSVRVCEAGSLHLLRSSEWDVGELCLHLLWSSEWNGGELCQPVSSEPLDWRLGEVSPGSGGGGAATNLRSVHERVVGLILDICCQDSGLIDMDFVT